MSIESNVADRKAAEALFKSMLDIAREDFLKLSERGRLIFFQTAYEHFAKRLGIDTALKQVSKPSARIESSASLNEDSLFAIQDLKNLIAMCEDIPPAGWDFASDVSESAREMIETIESSNRVTVNQLRAIENWTSGVARWLR